LRGRAVILTPVVEGVHGCSELFAGAAAAGAVELGALAGTALLGDTAPG
jgi:hypothetical protein